MAHCEYEPGNGILPVRRKIGARPSPFYIGSNVFRLTCYPQRCGTFVTLLFIPSPKEIENSHPRRLASDVGRTSPGAAGERPGPRSGAGRSRGAAAAVWPEPDDRAEAAQRMDALPFAVPPAAHLHPARGHRHHGGAGRMGGCLGHFRRRFHQCHHRLSPGGEGGEGHRRAGEDGRHRGHRAARRRESCGFPRRSSCRATWCCCNPATACRPTCACCSSAICKSRKPR